MIRRQPTSTLFPYTTLFRSCPIPPEKRIRITNNGLPRNLVRGPPQTWRKSIRNILLPRLICRDRKSTRLNSSHEWISYAVFCLKKKKKTKEETSTHINNNRC